MILKKKRIRFLVSSLVLLFCCLVGSNCHNFGGATTPNQQNNGIPAESDEWRSVAERYAPFIYHATDPVRGRQDLLSNIDFDGDYVGCNNWNNFEYYLLRPTVYYAALETETHYFISYHLFHPRDWNHFTIWMNDTHENDGENLQVVVRKSDGKVMLLLTQAHYKAFVYSNPGSGVEVGPVKIRGKLQLMDPEGIPHKNGNHAAVFVEAQGHGILGSLDRLSGVTVLQNGDFQFKERTGLLFRPALPGEPVTEPANSTSGTVPYQLHSLLPSIWPMLRNGMLTGDGHLFDGSYSYSDDFVSVAEVPRFYDGDRVSGPLGSDRGISPFALDFEWKRGTLGALFFNPAKRYPEGLQFQGGWSAQYVRYPFHVAPIEPTVTVPKE